MRNPGNVGEEEDLRNRRGRYDCVAVKRDVIKHGKVVGLFGHPFVGTADFKRFTYVWCKDNKVPGERGKPLAKVPIPAVCIGAEGRPRVGDGYLSALRWGVSTPRAGRGLSPGAARRAVVDSHWGSPSSAWRRLVWSR